MASLVLVVLAVWNGGLNWIADTLGILSPPNALFLIGVGALFVLALHFSVAFSRLSEETKILAQEVARLDREQRRIRKGALGGEATYSSASRRARATASRTRTDASATGSRQPDTEQLYGWGAPMGITRRRLPRDGIGAGAALTLGASRGLPGVAEVIAAEAGRPARPGYRVRLPLSDRRDPAARRAGRRPGARLAAGGAAP